MFRVRPIPRAPEVHAFVQTRHDNHDGQERNQPHHGQNRQLADLRLAAYLQNRISQTHTLPVRQRRRRPGLDVGAVLEQPRLGVNTDRTLRQSGASRLAVPGHIQTIHRLRLFILRMDPTASRAIQRRRKMACTLYSAHGRNVRRLGNLPFAETSLLRARKASTLSFQWILSNEFRSLTANGTSASGTQPIAKFLIAPQNAATRRLNRVFWRYSSSTG